MSFRVAAASSDGVHIDLHFGRADRFYIYEVEQDGSYRLLKINSPPAAEPASEPAAALRRVTKNDRPSGGCSPSGTGGCGSGGGGCGSGGGGCGGGAAALTVNTSYLEDAKYVLAAKIGDGLVKALARQQITAFPIELTVEEALQKIVIYEKRLNRFKKLS